MTDATESVDLGLAPRRSLRYLLAGALLATAVGVLVALLSVGGSGHGSKSPRATASAQPRSGIRAASTGRGRTSASAPGAGHVVSGPGGAHIVEAADPEEASSYPVPATVHHAAASAPATAGSHIIAPGAPSNAEVRAELAQMQAAERAAAQSQQTRLQPVPGGESVGGNGTIPIPENVPEVVGRVIAGANEIADFPYVFGGGHASFIDNSYDCSGSVSYALAAGGLISRPEVSGELESWGAPGPGRYITVLANAGHTYMYVDGVLFDTAGRSGPYASRWQVAPTDNAGYVVRHWPGL